MSKTLLQAQQSVDRFFTEAKECINQELGFSAMLTTFAVMEAVAEACKGKRSSSKSLIQYFTREMGDTPSWLIPPTSPIFLRSVSSLEGFNGSITRGLTDIRNGLVHNLSLPPHVSLAKDGTSAQEYARQNPDDYVINVSEFIESVKEMCQTLINRFPENVFDPQGNQNRSPAFRLPTSGVSTSDVSTS